MKTKITIAVDPIDLNAWRKTAGPEPLVRWITRHLNDASDPLPEKRKL